MAGLAPRSHHARRLAPAKTRQSLQRHLERLAIDSNSSEADFVAATPSISPMNRKVT